MLRLFRKPAPPAVSAAPVPVGSPGPLDVASLLGRPAVKLDTPEMQRFLAGRRVLVTGAGGSIGSEICRQALRFCPERLTLVDRSEFGLFEIDRELRARWIGADVRPVIADVGDADRIAGVLADERPHVVFHAAAHKHVPLMEQNPGEAVKNNALATHTLGRACAGAGVGHFVLVSTDKAVNPSSVMGATKRCAEMLIQGLAAGGDGTTRFSAVRFGNVLGSSGSVVPIFQRQIDAGGPVTVTHPHMRRFFMTIPEAAGLVMHAAATARGGEIFVLDMGEQVPILDLAHAMIRRAGLRVGDDVAVRFTGVRPGEKLEEQLAGTDEPTLATDHPKLRIWQLPAVSPGRASLIVQRLGGVVDAPRGDVLSALREVVPEFAPAEADAAPTLRLAA